jgi:cell division septum initiation protein DivIVA
MGDFNRRGATLGRPKPRSRFSELTDRLASTFATRDQTGSRKEANGQPDRSLDGDPLTPWDETPQRFPIARQGYECAAVDEHIADLEQELIALDREIAQLQAQTPIPGEVTTEIERVGEQTSAILIAAHEQAQQTTRQAQEEADGCVAAAAANAVAITSEAKEELRGLEREKRTLRQERERLIKDIRSVSESLCSVADDADERFPPDPQSTDPQNTGPQSRGPHTTGPQPAAVPEPGDGR